MYHAHKHDQPIKHIFIKKKAGLDVTPTVQGMYRSILDLISYWSEGEMRRNNYLMHRMQLGSWPYPKSR